MKTIDSGDLKDWHAHHNILFSSTSFDIGKIHWYLQKANTEMVDRCYARGESPLDLGEHNKGAVTPEKIKWQINTDIKTEFGNEVGSDEIWWWVFKKETDRDELSKRTNITLEYVQKLKEAAFTLKKRYNTSKYKSYLDLINDIKDFTEERKEEIHVLYDYVVWLNKKDILAPSILFTDHVWGLTRHSNLSVTISENSIGADDEGVKTCTEFALGIRSSSPLAYSLTEAFSEVSYDCYECDPEEPSRPSDLAVINKAAYYILDKLAVYFEKIRDSLRAINDKINEYKEVDCLLHRDSFWRIFIKKAMTQSVENDLWDFKETLEVWHAKNDEDVKISFCEKIAAFANAKGGVLIVGVTNEVPRKVVGVNDMEDRITSAGVIIEKYTDISNESVLFKDVSVADENDAPRICLVIAIAQTKDVTAVKNKNSSYFYPLRVGPGSKRKDRNEIAKSKSTVQSDNYAFIRMLDVFVRD